VTFGYGLLGFVDDYQKVTQKRNEAGLSARAKLIFQFAIATAVALAIYFDPSFDAELAVPFFKDFTPHLGALYVPLAVLVIVGFSNGVNLTDGLDGLAIGPVMIAAGTFLLLSYSPPATRRSRLPRDQVRRRQRPAPDLLRRAARRLAFWFNAYPPALHGRRRLARARRRSARSPC
jgi:UDP-N-acetylmuramyl pentapeptide phosphotransferase/UDP-N-acetylglucosamine-1-phosphate transferase